MQLKVYILIFSCIFFYEISAQTIDKDTLKTVNVIAKKDSILRITIINSNVPHYIINNDKLNELSANDIGDALKYIPGTYIKDYGGIGGLKTVSYRSLGASHTSVEVDGVILPTTQTAVVNLSSFDVFSTQRVEMTSGQVQNNFSTASAYIKSNLLSIQSTLFNTPKHKFNLKLMGMATSINSYQNGFFFQHKLNPKWSFGFQGLATYGSGKFPFSIQNVDTTYTSTRQNAELKNYNLKGAIIYQLPHLKVYLNGGYTNNFQQLPGAVILYNPYNDQTLGKTISKSSFNLQYSKNKYAIGFNLFGQQSFTTYRDNQFLNQQGYLENHYNNKALGTGFIISRFLNTSTQKIFLGLDLLLAQLSGDQFLISPTRTQVNSVLGISKWIWRLKFQGNFNHQFINDLTPSDEKTISHFSPFISLSFIPLKKLNLRLRTHYKNTYRLPSFNELYYNSIGNKNLRAENTQSLNLGVTFEKKMKQLNIETTIDFYQNKVKDKIVAIPTKNLFNWSMQNIGSVLSRGIDFNVLITSKINKHEFTFSSGQSFNSSIDVTSKNSITYGHQIPYTPKYSGNYALTYGYYKTYLTATILKSGSRYILNENTPYNLLEGFIDVSISVSRTFKVKNQKIYIKLQGANLLNNNYEMIKSFPMPGRYYRFKLVYNFNK
jgi:hypothetical protein